MARILLLALLLAGCATAPPLYGCEDLEEFGCPDRPPADDPETL